jgi:hypothetical protein
MPSSRRLEAALASMQQLATRSAILPLLQVALVTVLLLLPLDYLWWRLLGWL